MAARLLGRRHGRGRQPGGFLALLVRLSQQVSRLGRVDEVRSNGFLNPGFIRTVPAQETSLRLDWVMLAVLVVALIGWVLATSWLAREGWHWTFAVVGLLVLIRIYLGWVTLGTPGATGTKLVLEALRGLCDAAAWRTAADAGIAAFFLAGLIIMGRRWRRITDR